MKLTTMTGVALGALLLFPMTAKAGERLSEKGQNRLIRQVRHELVMLPNYGIFDNLEFRVEPTGTVVLLGQVRSLGLKNAAERVVKDVEGVERVENRIEMLPAGSVDDQIRMAVASRIYNQPSLQRYSLQAVPPIHIIVKNGQITLTGVVASQMDKQIAVAQASGVPGAFGVTDQLRISAD